MSNQPEPDYKAIWDELKDFAKKAPPHEPAWHIAWGAVVEKMRDLETLSAQGEQGTQTYEEARICPDCDGYGSLGHAPDGRLISCESCGGHEDSIGTGVIKAVISPTPTAQEPPTETQERCPKCKTEVEWVVPPIPGVKPFFQCQDPDCNWMSDDDFPVTESK